MEAISTRKVRYVGEREVVIPSTGQVVRPGDEIEVGDDFVNAAFVDVPSVPAKKSKKETEES